MWLILNNDVLKKSLACLCVILQLGLFSCNNSVSKDACTNLEPLQFKGLINNDSVLLIDVRTPKEYKALHLPQAVNIDFFSNDFSEAVKKLDRNKSVFIYCRSGKRSSKSIPTFKAAGFAKIYNLNGGIKRWQSLKLPLETN
jgi:rhodanese-related sulfurtransferase